MIDVENSIVVQRPPKDVFAVVSDLTNEPKWHTDVARAKKTSPGPLAPGTTYEFEAAKPVMGITRVQPRVVGLEPNRSISFDTQFGKMLIHRTYRVEPEGSGSRVVHQFRTQPTGMMRLMGFMMRRQVSKAWDGFLGNMKTLLEK